MYDTNTAVETLFVIKGFTNRVANSMYMNSQYQWMQNPILEDSTSVACQAFQYIPKRRVDEIEFNFHSWQL